MKTLTKTMAAMFALALVAGCTAAAQDPAPTATGPGFGPGWRHEQMVQARAKGELPPGPMMPGAMMGRGFGPGPGAAQGRLGPPLNADGTIDTAQLPPWCPMRQAAQPDAAK
ncbi:hypothetical protein [Magnetospirillum sp. UT-4]|uniref:hypothetical protein n=1 Tax=Magnetospirillum sp. UT-4 TaxID=2681467 RepID=UPI001381CF6C|nr:hypothetical protein [Magnetospirillum sp. UT-4]CAA7613195.1 Secreted protein [Magnetospirillum sp. UT-4]